MLKSGAKKSCSSRGLWCYRMQSVPAEVNSRSLPRPPWQQSVNGGPLVRCHRAVTAATNSNLVVPGRAGPGSGHGLQSARGREVVASYTKSAKLTKCSAGVVIVKRDGKWAPVLT